MAKKREGVVYKEVNGEYFSKSAKSGYWLNTRTKEGLHRYVWRLHYGAIPKGFHVHHIDGNKSNNDISNLTLLTHSAHSKLHGKTQSPETLKKRQENCDRIRDLTKAWHASDEGREWHKQHYDGMKGKLHKKTEYVCDCCGKTYVSVVRSTAEHHFCSNACKAKFRRKMGLDNVVKRCEYCGKEFSSNKYDKIRFCGNSCSNKWKHERKAEKDV